MVVALLVAAMLGAGPGDAAAEPGSRGRHRVGIDVGLGGNAFSTDIPVSADYAVFFTRDIGWRAISATYVFSVPTALAEQLAADFNVLPTAATRVGWFADTAFALEHPFVANRRMQLRGGFALGAAAVGMVSSGAVGVRVRPGASLTVSLLCAYSGGGPFQGLGVRLSGHGMTVVDGSQVLLVAWGSLGIQGAWGAAR